MTTSPLHSLDIRLLRYFSVVAEENNMSRAALRLFMSQPPLSRHIRQLEERLGVTLFIRHTRGLTLTEDGLRVLEIVRPLLALQDKTWAALSQIAKTGEQSLRLGYILSVMVRLNWRVMCVRENWMQRWWRYRLRIRVLASCRSAGKNR